MLPTQIGEGFVGEILELPAKVSRDCHRVLTMPGKRVQFDQQTWKALDEARHRHEARTARSPCRKAIRIMVASRCPCRLAFAASTRPSTSAGVKCSRVEARRSGVGSAQLFDLLRLA
jgi:hypothetical protein